MVVTVLIAHAKGEDEIAEQLAAPIREAGYEVAHRGTVMVGESFTEETQKVLAEGGPVVLCGTERAVGTRWAKRIVQAAHSSSRSHVFVVQVEEEADVEALNFDTRIASYWQNPAAAVKQLLDALRSRYPLDAKQAEVLLSSDAERRYRDLALESCDIVDLANLPESDRHIATRKLFLRRLYVALRVQVDVRYSRGDETALSALEKRRLARDKPSSTGERVSLGAQLSKVRRIVVLGDPGAGKTTLIRWIATAYLLRLKDDPDWRALPDVASLPDADWLPVIIRCRELDATSVSGSFDDILGYTLRKAELTPQEAVALQAVLRDKLERGEALLLLDGLDEIIDPALRIRFCKQLERIHSRYPKAPIVATSRIVGYREMGYSIGEGFEHVTVAEFSRDDKDEFARRWCALTELPERVVTVTADLINDIHSSDRIERLTSNPMLLTTMALVRRKLGKLPSHRADLYWEAVQVLLNWRAEVDRPIDHHEAIPQLEYLAYAMCNRGVQQLREDEVLALFTSLREEYPQIYEVRNHNPVEFLHLLERRTGLLVEVGTTRYLGRNVPVYEFRHLTFQEYLAALAMVHGCFPGRDRNMALAEVVAPLVVPEETLRLCVTICSNDDVDKVLQAIYTPLQGEDVGAVARPRAIVAALCLAEEPNASLETARQVLQTLVAQIKEGDGNNENTMDAVVKDLSQTRWLQLLRLLLLEEFCRIDCDRREYIGNVYLITQDPIISDTTSEVVKWVYAKIAALSSAEKYEIVDAALYVAYAAALYTREMKVMREALQIVLDPETLVVCVSRLLSLLSAETPVPYSAAWALAWLSKKKLDHLRWIPSTNSIELIALHLSDVDASRETIEPLLIVLDTIRDVRLVEPLLLHLTHKDKQVRSSIAKLVGGIGSERAVGALRYYLDDGEENVRRAAVGALLQYLEDQIDQRLLTRDLDAIAPYLDSHHPIVEKQVQDAALRLNLPPDEIRRRYEALAPRFKLRLEWQQDTAPRGGVL